MPPLTVIGLALALIAPQTPAAATGDSLPQPLHLMPVPRHVERRPGRLALDSTFRIAITRHRSPRLERAALRLLDRVEPIIAAPLSRTITRDTAGAAPLLVIDVSRAGQHVQSPEEDESYTLTVNTRGAYLHATTTVGALRGLETVLQLVQGDQTGFYLPAVSIEDAPRFAWRGLLVDVSRHFEPVDEIERTLDGMAAVKLNVFHWHLSDDQGVRVESRRFPLLQRRASDGQFYTQRQIRHIIAYARDRGIRVVPEFDMPGHSVAFITAYPALASKRDTTYQLGRRWGGFDAVMDPTREYTYRFIDRFIGEMTSLFPDRYWHIGGDEVNGKQWNSQPHIVRFKRRHHLADNAALQAYFNRRLSRIVARHHRRMIGWDEVLHTDLPRGTIVQSWRGTKYLGQAAAMGFQGILSAPYYLDAMRSAEWHYLADPLPPDAGLTPAQESLVLGGEACMWAELVNPGTIDSRIWPRLAAIAERFWSPASVRDVADMYRRLDYVSTELEQMGLDVGSHTERFLRRIVAGTDIAPLATLLYYTEPVNLHWRIVGQHPVQATPLVWIVDAAVPDPPGRWLVSRLATRYVTSRDTATRDSLQAIFRSWLPLPAEVTRITDHAPLAAGALPAAQALAGTATTALAALQALDSRTPPAPGWRDSVSKGLADADKSQGLLHITVVPAVQSLVDAALRPVTP